MSTDLELTTAQLEAFCKETRSIITKIMSAYQLKTEEIARCVELYYDSQKLRLMHQNKQRTEDPTAVLEWFNFWLGMGEAIIRRKLVQWLQSPDCPKEATWALDQIGIGPVLAAGLAAHIDVAKARTISSVWKFAGLAPGHDKKVKGQKREYNSRLKTLCWKLGESFVKVSGKEGAIYGHLYAQFKSEEVRRNEAGEYKTQAEHELKSKNFSDNPTRKKLEAGYLSDAQLHSRAKRKAVKIFLSHYWVTAREARGLEVSEPYAIQILGHSGKILGTAARSKLT